MATRLNLPNAVGAETSLSPAYDAGWDWTDFAVRARIGPRRLNTPRGGRPAGLHRSGTTDLQDVLFVQYVSDPLAAQTISGTARGVLATRESAGGANARAQLKIRVCSNDGTSFTGTLLDFDTAGLTNELTTATAPFPNVRYPQAAGQPGNTTLSSVDAQEGDRLVIELGLRCHTTSGTDFTFSYHTGDDADLADCAEDEVGTTGSPWLEFSQDLVWGANYTVSSMTIDTSYAGGLPQAILDARTADHDVLYLEAGTYTYGTVTNDTAGEKMLRVTPAVGVERDDVTIDDGTGVKVVPTGVRYLSFENLGIRRGITLEKSYRFQTVGCKLSSCQFEAQCARTLIEGCEMGGVFGLANGAYAILASVDVDGSGRMIDGSGLSDLRIIGCNFSNNMNNTYVRIGWFDNAVFDRNTIETAVRDVLANQDVTVTGTGTFTLSMAGQTTGALAHNASAATVQTALRALSTVGSGGVTCSGTLAAGMSCDFITSAQSATSSVTWPTALLTKDATGLGGGTVTITSAANHTDGFRTFTGEAVSGVSLRFTNNYVVGGDYQGFFMAGGDVHDAFIANNFFGACTGSFRAFAVGDETTRIRLCNNTFEDSGGFGDGSVATSMISFNNLFLSSGSFSFTDGASAPGNKRDYNVYGGGTAGVTLQGSETLTVPTVVGGGDFHLTAGSASGIDFGAASFQGIDAPTTDINGDIRTFPCEAGAYEGVV